MSEADSLFAVLRNSADADTVAAIERLVRDGTDRDLCRINVLAFAGRHALNEQRVISAFLHAARLGLFELSWNVLCPGCSGVLDANASLKGVRSQEYCAFCAAGYEPTLDENVEVTFTVTPRVRPIAAHAPNDLPFHEYIRQLFFGSGVDLPDDYLQRMDRIMLDAVELPAGEKAQVSLQLPAGSVILFDPVTHAAHYFEVKGEPTGERRTLSIAYGNVKAATQTTEMPPGPLRITLDNRAPERVLPGLWISGPEMNDMIGRRRPFLTAKRLLTNQTFRDLYRTDTLDIDQRLKITSLTFLFTDLKGSTDLYERVGDLVAFDLVQTHFKVLHEIVGQEAGAVVKTIGDAVMATFPTPDRALAAALRMRDAMDDLNRKGNTGDLLLKIGIHEGPCLAVNLNERQDYFGQTVNIASRVQGLAGTRAILTTAPVVRHPEAAAILRAGGLSPTVEQRAVRGLAGEVAVYEIP
ncbi:MAG TPA: adenylate/guanylate cyclase domain-containing protein [Reyranella sp.]|nr:adenylate/guanylate cyclase domain-containing protein [Reyranella sp.]